MLKENTSLKKRPLDGVFSDDEGDDNSMLSNSPNEFMKNPNGNAKDNKTENPEEPILEAEELIRTKKNRFYKPFTEDLLISREGVDRIYTEFPKHCKFRKGSEAKDLTNLMNMYNEWAFQLHPSFACSDVLMRTEILGHKARIRNYMELMRNREMNRFLEEVIGVKPMSREEAETDEDSTDRMAVNALDSHPVSSNDLERAGADGNSNTWLNRSSMTDMEEDALLLEAARLYEETVMNTFQEVTSAEAVARKPASSGDEIDEEEEIMFDSDGENEDASVPTKGILKTQIEGQIAFANAEKDDCSLTDRFRINQVVGNEKDDVDGNQSEDEEEITFDSDSDGDNDIPFATATSVTVTPAELKVYGKQRTEQSDDILSVACEENAPDFTQVDCTQVGDVSMTQLDEEDKNETESFMETQCD